MTMYSIVRTKIVVVCLLTVTGVVAAPGDDYNDGKAVGSTHRTPLLDGIKSGTAASTSPNHTATPAESSYYGRSDLSAEAAAQRAACAAAPNDPRCAAINSGTASGPKQYILPSDPALAADSVTRDPSKVLGDITTTYNACSSAVSLISPATYATQTCTTATAAWNANPCDKTLDVAPVDRMSCTAGQLMSVTRVAQYHASINKVVPTYADVQCNLTRTDGALRFQLGSCVDCPQAVPMTGVDIDISQPRPLPGTVPTPIASLPMKYGLMVNVYEDGPGCVGTACVKNIYFFVSGGFQATYSCPPGQTHGTDLEFEVPLGSGTWVPGPAGTCFAVAATGGSPARHVVTGITDQYASVGPGTVTGFSIDPASSYSVSTLNFTRPSLLKKSGDYWDNQCAPFEARTPPSALPPDGVNVPLTPPLMPLVANDQCQRVASTCLDGPSTKVIDGIAVTRECWRYANQFDCTTLLGGSTCNTPPLNACAPTGAATCSLSDAAAPPHCLTASMTVECKVSDPVYGPVTNCGPTTFCPGGTCWDTTTTTDPDFAQSISMLEAARQAAKDIDPNTLRTFNGRDERCVSWPLDCCTTAPSIPLACQADEKKLAERRDLRLCHSVEEGWCSSRVLGVCVQRTNTYCCFGTKMSRIVNEQGRPQIGKVWGSGQTPDCTGFLLTELMTLDFAAMDLSEFYADIVAKMPDVGAIQGTATSSAGGCYYGGGKC